ncbi:phospholipase D-like domain-containing protein [Streptomyces sp. NBC_00059]|uniref:phospholipase D-like domain-containing protein n=1 Tax=Streptomyces sp. NBC_00059 TaxID=2975635 RepID=UPI00225287AB|nr:phospholipase D-like domain-containing protein [Streptomyces sp. NBC_00059]MCX5411583.1 phospholipase D-like domain-containing protein [Streptomyces sp. NBC_00059]
MISTLARTRSWPRPRWSASPRSSAPGKRAAGVLLAVAACVAALLAPAQTADAATVPTTPVFNKPTGTAAEQQAILTQVRSVIANADSGSVLRLAMYHLWDEEVAADLGAAKARGVSVKVVLDESTLDYPSSYDLLKSSLGTSTSAASWVALCAKGRSCLSTEATGINHNKFLLASSVGGGAQKNVVVQLTSNLTPSNYKRYWNSAVTVAGNTALYDGYVDYFTRLPAQNRTAWSYTYGNAGDYKYYFFPRAGSDATTDTVVNAMDNITCRWTDSAGTARRTTVHAAMLKITRQAVADKLRALAGQGCLVDLVYSETDSGTWSALHGVSGITNRCYQHDDDGDGGAKTPNRIVHSKNWMVDGMYADTVQKVMFTGSHNWSGPALRNNDEAMLRITTPAVFDAFEANFQATRSAAVPGTSDNVAACKS